MSKHMCFTKVQIFTDFPNIFKLVLKDIIQTFQLTATRISLSAYLSFASVLNYD